MTTERIARNFRNTVVPSQAEPGRPHPLGCASLRASLAAALVLTAPLVGLPAALAADALTVDRIDTRAQDDGREVLIAASSKPTFSVFRLSEPFRILVDISDAQLKAPIGLKRVDDGVIRYIATNQFSDESATILRVEIALESESPYDVRADGNTVVVSIGKRTPAQDRIEPSRSSAAAPTAPVPTQADPEPKAKAFEPVRVGKLSRVVRGKSTTLTAKILSGRLEKDAVTLEAIENPPRLVLDLAGTQATPSYQKVNVGRLGVQRARVGEHQEGLRIVLDMAPKAALPQVDVTAENDVLKIVLQKAEVAAAPAPANEPAPVAVRSEARRPASPSRRVVDVRFEPKEGFVRLTLELDGPVTPEKGETSANNPSLRIPHAALPKDFERTLDVAKVSGNVVSAISTYLEGDDTIVSAQIDEGTEHRHWQKGNRLMWDFRATRPVAARAVAAKTTPTTVLPYPEQATSGYASEASTAALRSTTLAPQKQRYQGRRISLDLKDADIQNVLRLLADVSKLNIVASDDVKGRVTIKLRNVPWDQALDIILRSKQLDKSRVGNIIRVAPIEVLRKEEALRLERQNDRLQLEPLTVRLIPVSYAVAKEIQPQINALLSPRGKVNIDKRTNVLIVEDIADVLSKVERLVRTLDTQTPQVLIEARIVEARSSFSRNLGVQWGGSVSLTPQYGTSTGLGFPNSIRIGGGSDDNSTPTAGVLSTPNFAVNLPAAVGTGAGGSLGFILGSAGGSTLLNLRLSAAEEAGKVKIISAPKIVTVDNKEAKILSGEKIPITVVTANGPSTRFINANIELQVTPHVTQDGSILMKINATKNELSDRVDLLGVPGIITKEAETEMIVRDGDTAVLGGLYRRTATESKSYVPWFGKIPVLGWLFKSTSKSDARDELLIFISPRIVNRSQALVAQ